jgi:hypothetical protein
MNFIENGMHKIDNSPLFCEQLPSGPLIAPTVMGTKMTKLFFPAEYDEEFHD